jgi:NADH:ubiquinone oxidoreductase subunit 3 (subunit A)
MIAITVVIVTICAMALVTVFALVAVAVRREERAARLPVEAGEQVTATARRIAGLHVRRASVFIRVLPDVRPARRLRGRP